MSNVNPNLNVVVRNREQVLLEEKVSAVTSYNDKGVFDILPEHENFISLIKDRIIIHRGPKDKPQEIRIDNGIMRVYQDNVYLYLNF